MFRVRWVGKLSFLKGKGRSFEDSLFERRGRSYGGRVYLAVKSTRCTGLDLPFGSE